MTWRVFFLCMPFESTMRRANSCYCPSPIRERSVEFRMRDMCLLSLGMLGEAGAVQCSCPCFWTSALLSWKVCSDCQLYGLPLVSLKGTKVFILQRKHKTRQREIKLVLRIPREVSPHLLLYRLSYNYYLPPVYRLDWSSNNAADLYSGGFPFESRRHGRFLQNPLQFIIHVSFSNLRASLNNLRKKHFFHLPFKYYRMIRRRRTPSPTNNTHK